MRDSEDFQDFPAELLPVTLRECRPLQHIRVTSCDNQNIFFLHRSSALNDKKMIQFDTKQNCCYTLNPQQIPWIAIKAAQNYANKKSRPTTVSRIKIREKLVIFIFNFHPKKKAQRAHTTRLLRELNVKIVSVREWVWKADFRKWKSINWSMKNPANSSPPLPTWFSLSILSLLPQKKKNRQTTKRNAIRFVFQFSLSRRRRPPRSVLLWIFHANSSRQFFRWCEKMRPFALALERKKLNLNGLESEKLLNFHNSLHYHVAASKAKLNKFTFSRCASLSSLARRKSSVCRFYAKIIKEKYKKYFLASTRRSLSLSPQQWRCISEKLGGNLGYDFETQTIIKMETILPIFSNALPSARNFFFYVPTLCESKVCSIREKEKNFLSIEHTFQTAPGLNLHFPFRKHEETSSKESESEEQQPGQDGRECLHVRITLTCSPSSLLLPFSTSYTFLFFCVIFSSEDIHERQKEKAENFHNLANQTWNKNFLFTHASSRLGVDVLQQSERERGRNLYTIFASFGEV